MNIGIIGSGRWAEVHKNTLEKLGHPVAGFLVNRPESRVFVETDWDTPATTDLEEFLNWPIDAVIVVSPNFLHADHTIACLNAGKHVLCEKPMATSVADAEKMLKVAESANKVLAIGLIMRNFILYETIKDLIDSGKIGETLHLKLDLWRKPYRTGTGGWKQDLNKLGNAILEEPIHYLDLTSWFMGKATNLQAWANSRPERDYLNENLDIRLEFENGASGLVTRSIAAFEHHINLKIVGTTGSISASWDGEMDLTPTPDAKLVLHNADGKQIIEILKENGPAYENYKQTEAFISAIQNQTAVPATGQDGLASVKLCMLVEESLKQNSAKLEVS